MNNFCESRWRMAVPWSLLLAALLLAQVIPIVTNRGFVSWVLWLCVACTSIQVMRQIVFPRLVVSINAKTVKITGVRPGWWKFFQSWRTVEIPFENITKVRVGRIRDQNVLGLMTPPWGEPSRARSLQNFLWINYKENGVAREIYYPHINDIADFPKLVEILREIFYQCFAEFL